MKKYFIKYTIHDGGFEYGDNSLYSSETDPDDTKAFEFEFVTTFWDKDDLEWDFELERWYVCDGRFFEITDIKEIPEEDYKVLIKYM